MDKGESQGNSAAATIAAVQRFNDAFNRHDVAAVLECMTDDCIFEDTWPPPDGKRYQGQAEVRIAWEEFFSSSPHAVFEFEEIFACGNRCVVRWTYRWLDREGRPGHVRGVDVMRVRDGRVAEKLSYVKG